MLEMFSTSTKVCHYIVWTPVGTKIFVCERDGYIDLLLNYLHKFWELASGNTEPVWHADIFGLKQKAKEIALKSTCICSTSTSFIIPEVLNHQDLKQFTDAEKSVKKSTVRKCQGCKDEEWKCKLNPCEVRAKRQANAAKSSTMSYPSYKLYGSSGIHNSCHQDTFLEVSYHSLRQLHCLSWENLGALVLNVYFTLSF